MHVSEVQDAAVEVLLVMEERLRTTSFVERFKLAVVSADPKWWIPKMFPEWSAPSERVVENTEDLDLDEENVEWVFEEGEIDPAEAQRLLEEMLQQRSGSDVLDPTAFGEWEG